MAFLLRPRHRPFVRQHAGTSFEGLEPQAREEAPLRPLDVRPRDAVPLLVDVRRPPRILAQRPVRPPRRERSGRSTIRVLFAVRALGARHLDPHRVLRMLREERTDLVRSDDVVWRGNDATDIADRLGVVAERTERADLGHRLLGGRLVVTAPGLGRDAAGTGWRPDSGIVR